MSLIRFHKVKKSFAGVDVLDGVSFELGHGARVGLVGENGGGKSTILKLMAGRLAPDAGTVGVARSATVWYVPQTPENGGAATALDEVFEARPVLAALRLSMSDLERRIEAGSPSDAAEGTRYAEALAEYAELGGYGFEQDARDALAALGIGPDTAAQPLASLSGGERARVALSKALLADPDLLLLDEPDNHLDLAGLRWLQEMLCRRRGAFVLATHDRTLLEQAADAILEIEDGRVTAEAGSFAAFLERKRERLEGQMHEWVEQQRRVRRLQASAREVEQRARDIEASTVNFHYRKRAMKVAARAVALKQRIERQIEGEDAVEKPRPGREAIRLELGPPAARSRWLLRAEHLQKSLAGRLLFQDAHLGLQRGQRVAVVGPNGSGKTTLLEVLLARQPADSGEVWRAPGARVFYCDQRHGGLDPRRSVYEQMTADTALDATQIHHLLARLLFRRDAVHKRIGDLSGGERTRLVLALLVNAAADLLVLDEPTNHLDLGGVEVLEQALSAFDGAVLFVSHDRQLVESVATEVLELRDGLLSPQEPVPAAPARG
jgi:ATP-binding cassette, subfamily F, member 3